MLLFGGRITAVRTCVNCQRLSGRGHVDAAAGGRFDLPATVGALRDSHRAAVIERERGVLKLRAALAAAHALNFHSAVGARVFGHLFPPVVSGSGHS